jgi:shikimate kinase
MEVATWDPIASMCQSGNGPSVVAVALANKMAGTIWALTAHGRVYRRGYVGRVALGAA